MYYLFGSQPKGCEDLKNRWEPIINEEMAKDQGHWTFVAENWRLDERVLDQTQELILINTSFNLVPEERFNEWCNHMKKIENWHQLPYVKGNKDNMELQYGKNVKESLVETELIHLIAVWKIVALKSQELIKDKSNKDYEPTLIKILKKDIQNETNDYLDSISNAEREEAVKQLFPIRLNPNINTWATYNDIETKKLENWLDFLGIYNRYDDWYTYFKYKVKDINKLFQPTVVNAPTRYLHYPCSKKESHGYAMNLNLTVDSPLIKEIIHPPLEEFTESMWQNKIWKPPKNNLNVDYLTENELPNVIETIKKLRLKHKEILKKHNVSCEVDL